MTTTTTILLKAAEVVEHGWTRGANARNESGKPIAARSPKARRWSACGAIYRAVDTSGPRQLNGLALWGLIDYLELEPGPAAEVVGDWNDRLKTAAEAAAGLRGAAEAATTTT